MGFFNFVFSALIFIIGFLYPSFTLYTYLVFVREKPKLQNRLLKVLEHFVVMVLFMCFALPLDYIFGGFFYSLIKFIFVYMLIRNKYDLAHKLYKYVVLQISSAFPDLLEIAEQSHILPMMNTFMLAITTMITVFNEQYERILSEID